MAIDPITAATTFATLTSLISDFRSQRKELSENDYKEFLEWLSENRHDEIKAVVEKNQETIISIKAILNQDYAVIAEKLQAIDGKLASLLSGDDLFSNLVEAISPQHSLSKQALNILAQFEESKASEILEVRFITEGTKYIFMDGKGGDLDFNQPRFIEDDFESLVELSLLRKDFASKGEPVYKYTRAASEFVARMKKI
ncbi:MAG: hypothetical protein V3U89_00015 [Methylophilaceae bacterium]